MSDKVMVVTTPSNRKQVIGGHLHDLITELGNLMNDAPAPADATYRQWAADLRQTLENARQNLQEESAADLRRSSGVGIQPAGQ